MVQVWADGHFELSSRKGGLGVVIRKLIPDGIEERRIYKRVFVKDNNLAELEAILLGVLNLPKKNPEGIFIITDSIVAINAIKYPEKHRGRYQELGSRIKYILGSNKWQIYHKKAHTENKDRYSQLQALTDRIAKGR